MNKTFGNNSADLGYIIDNIAKHEALDINRFVVIDEQSRPFSRYIIIKAEFYCGITQSYFVKFAKFSCLQYKRLLFADEIFKSNDAVFKLAPLYLEEIGAVVYRSFSGLPLNAMLRLNAAGDPVRWYRQIKRGLYLAGAWLRHYHAHAIGRSSDEAILLRFIDGNASSLDLLTTPHRKKLLEHASLPIVEDPVMPHGDYMMHNVLMSGKQICVIDVGLGSLPSLIADWDIVTFKVSFDRACRFNLRTPLHWIPMLRHSIYKSFEEGYGKSGSKSREYFLCLAIRHFILLETAVERKNVDVVKWHLDEISRSLERL